MTAAAVPVSVKTIVAAPTTAGSGVVCLAAVIVLEPAEVPSVKLVEAYPLASEIAVAEPTEPPPVFTVKVMTVSLTGFPLTSTT